MALEPFAFIQLQPRFLSTLCNHSSEDFYPIRRVRKLYLITHIISVGITLCKQFQSSYKHSIKEKADIPSNPAFGDYFELKRYYLEIFEEE